MINTEKNDPTKNTVAHTTNDSRTATPKGMRYVFGIFMIIIYLGMGCLMLANFFYWTEDLAWVRYSLGFLFILYGIWRAYRQFKGIY